LEPAQRPAQPAEDIAVIAPLARDPSSNIAVPDELMPAQPPPVEQAPSSGMSGTSGATRAS